MAPSFGFCEVTMRCKCTNEDIEKAVIDTAPAYFFAFTMSFGGITMWTFLEFAALDFLRSIF